MPKFIPAIFTSIMVQALLDNCKNMTRRQQGLEEINKKPDDWELLEVFTKSGKYEIDPVYRYENKESGHFIDFKCPYGQPGDVLWVKENFKVQQVDRIYVDEWMQHICIDYVANDHRAWIWVKESEVPRVLRRKHPDKVFMSPSIFLPKCASRIFLQVTAVRLERLHDITEEDAIGEGVEIETQHSDFTIYKKYDTPKISGGFTQAKISFESLWETLNGNWSANPWVWVIAFKKIERPSDFLLTPLSIKSTKTKAALV